MCGVFKLKKKQNNGNSKKIHQMPHQNIYTCTFGKRSEFLYTSPALFISCAYILNLAPKKTPPNGFIAVCAVFAFHLFFVSPTRPSSIALRCVEMHIFCACNQITHRKTRTANVQHSEKERDREQSNKHVVHMPHEK